MKAVAYLRVSGQSQVDGEGFGRQLETVTACAKAHDCEIIRVYRRKLCLARLRCRRSSSVTKPSTTPFLMPLPLMCSRFLIDSNDLTQRSLATELGSETTVSLVLSGKRQLTRNQIAKPSVRFNVSPAAFFPRLRL
jgi:hypothetical protein